MVGVTVFMAPPLSRVDYPKHLSLAKAVIPTRLHGCRIHAGGGNRTREGGGEMSSVAVLSVVTAELSASETVVSSYFSTVFVNSRLPCFPITNMWSRNGEVSDLRPLFVSVSLNPHSVTPPESLRVMKATL
jgi:hypothetical protein